MPAPSPLVADSVRSLAGDGLGQLLRFAIAGFAVTLFSATIYLWLAGTVHVPPLAATAISHACGIGAGYLVHSRWSFRATPTRESATALRFAIVSGLGFVLNASWVWIFVHALRAPVWAPVPAMMVLTPLASFALNRQWVFAKA